METLSVSAVSMGVLGGLGGWALGLGTDGHAGRMGTGTPDARAKGQKIGARQTHRNPMGRKRSVSPTARPA